MANLLEAFDQGLFFQQLIKFAFSGFGMRGLVLEWRSPILPAEGADECRRERFADGLCGFPVAPFRRVEDAEKKNPGQFGNEQSARLQRPAFLNAMSLALKDIGVGTRQATIVGHPLDD